jgi:WD40-like Beta Propeller Repeat
VRVDADEELVFLDLDSAEDAQARARPRRRWLWLLLPAVLAGGVLVQANRHPAAPAAAPSTRPTTPSASAPAPQPASTAAVTVTQLERPLLGETGDWTLFGRGERTLVRIDLARNEITRTVLPPLQSSGPVYFVPAAGEVIIRPLDFVPGYVVPDGQPTSRLPAGFGPGGPIFPGPDPGHVWVDAGGDQSQVVLTALDGHLTGTVIRLPAGSSSLEAFGDGAGYLLFPTADGIYRAQPGRVQRISTGRRLIAVGPTGWLIAECDRQQRCQRVLIDRTTNRRRILGPEITNGTPPPCGAISPDGRTAAIFDVGSGGYYTIDLLDLRTGFSHATGIDLQESGNDGVFRWSPDGRWLFAIDVNGGVAVLDLATDQVRSLPGPLPPLTQLAVRADG